MNKKPKPIKASPEFFVLLFFENSMGIAMPMAGRTKIEIENLKPKKATIQKVRVVPKFAPMITPIDWRKEMILAFTKLTIITVVAELDCTIEVMKKPVKIPLNRCLVITPKEARSLSPVKR